MVSYVEVGWAKNYLSPVTLSCPRLEGDWPHADQMTPAITVGGRPTAVTVVASGPDDGIGSV